MRYRYNLHSRCTSMFMLQNNYIITCSLSNHVKYLFNKCDSTHIPMIKNCNMHNICTYLNVHQLKRVTVNKGHGQINVIVGQIAINRYTAA